jgi:NADH-quinone oxidoreductase subunit E
MEALVWTEKYTAEIAALLAKYPREQRRSAVMPLLHLAQQAQGVIAGETLAEVGTLTGLSTTEVASVAGFYTLFLEHPEGKRRVQICTDLPCALRGADQFAEELCANLRIKMGETTADGQFTVETVTCLAGCDKAPLFQVQDPTGIHYYESRPDQPMTVAQALEVLERLKGGG